MFLQKQLVIATRESRLALWQAEFVQGWVKSHCADVECRLLGMTTQGDRILDKPLALIGGKGLFVKELEVALSDGRAHLAVHSMKDLPMELPPGFRLAATPAREVVQDALVSNRYQTLDDLPDGAVIGTSSLRRRAFLLATNPTFKIVSLRGNLDTRLKKLDDGLYDAIVLAAAGLTRLGLKARIKELLDPSIFVPAPGQGALGLEYHESAPWVASRFAPLHDTGTAACVQAERTFSAALGGGCEVPLGALCTCDGENIRLSGRLASFDGQLCIDGSVTGLAADCVQVGQQLAQMFLEKGAQAILQQCGLSLPFDGHEAP